MGYSKTRLLLLIFSCLLLVGTMPLSVYAYETGGTQQGTGANANKKTTQENIKRSASSTDRCKVISSLAEKIQSQLSERTEKVNEKRASVAKKLEEKAASRNVELSKKREEWDQKRQANFDKLRGFAKTETQKQAVEEYILAVTDAVKTRRSANDAALETFRNEMSSLKSSLSQSTNESITSTSAKISQAATDATLACEAGQSVESVRGTFKSVVNAAREELKGKRESGGEKNEQVLAIIKKKNAALKTNQETFLTSTKSAREKLKTALKTSIQTPASNTQ